MTDEAYPSSAAGRAGEETTGSAVGLILFAGIMMIMVGCFQFFEGLVAVTLAVLSAIANLLWLPYNPFSALTLITLDVFVIWAVAAHGRVMRESY
jgi:hypothetical protein